MGYVYIACPYYAESRENFQGIKEQLRSLGLKTKDHQHLIDPSSSYYNQKLLDDSSAVVVMLGNNNWEANIMTLAPGVKSELLRAKKIGIPIYLGYKSQTGYNIYSCRINITDHISGIGGSTNNARVQLLDLCSKEDKKEDIKDSSGSMVTYDIETNVDLFPSMRHHTFPKEEFDPRILLAYG